MQKLTLCMVVKDEINRIAGCLDPIVDLVEDMIIIDTGSTDGTPDFLRRRYGIEPEILHFERKHNSCLAQVRNRAFDQADTPWILSLDADERIAPDGLQCFRNLPDDPEAAGYFGKWLNYRSDAPPFEDYKLVIFRRGYYKRGLEHENVQYDIRKHGARAVWLDGLSVEHFPEACKFPAKAQRYRANLQHAIAQEPHWYRYHWFLGYMDFLEERWDSAASFLAAAAESNSRAFPVECLNSYMVLAEIKARNGLYAEVQRMLEAALEFYVQVKDDFEVAVNFRLETWLHEALSHCRAERWDAVKAYAFAR